jgi:hypothetical protein
MENERLSRENALLLENVDHCSQIIRLALGALDDPMGAIGQLTGSICQ